MEPLIPKNRIFSNITIHRKGMSFKDSNFSRINVDAYRWSCNDKKYKLPVQSMLITTTILGSTPVHGDVYSLQHYVIKFVSDL
jgi:hypothetical protein